MPPRTTFASRTTAQRNSTGEGAPDVAAGAIGHHWYNVHNPLDLLSSNFRDGMTGIPGEMQPSGERATIAGESKPLMVWIEGIGQDRREPETIGFRSLGNRTNLSWTDILTLAGFQAHSRYWQDEFQAEYSAFDELVPRLFGHTWLLDGHQSAP